MPIRRSSWRAGASCAGLDCCVCFPQHTGKANARSKTMDQYSGRSGSALPDGSRMVHVLQPWEDSDEKLTPPYGFTIASGETALILARAKGSYHAKQPRIWLKRKGYAFEHTIEPRRDKDAERRAYADRALYIPHFRAEAIPAALPHQNNPGRKRHHAA